MKKIPGFAAGIEFPYLNDKVNKRERSLTVKAYTKTYFQLSLCGVDTLFATVSKLLQENILYILFLVIYFKFIQQNCLQ